MTETRVPAGVPTGGQFAASARGESRINLNSPGMADQPPPAAPAPSLPEQMARALEKQMGCGPGEMIVQNGYGPYGEPIQQPVGQMCTSSAHNHAYYEGSCQFAAEMAATALGIIQQRLDDGAAAEQKLRRIDQTLDTWVAQPSYSGNYDADTSASHAIYEASGFVKAVIDGSIDQPAPEPAADPWASATDPNADPSEPPF